MRAVVFRKSLPIEDPAALLDATLPRPEPEPHDLLVRVEAVSVNPVDTKVRRRGDPEGGERVLGWDAAGRVEAVGAAVTLFRPGDEVYYAGSILRPGTNAEFHLVDERIVGRKPATLGFPEAAALPLTAITAWELLFDRIGVARGEGRDRRSLLVVGAAGGVGSIALQLARHLTGLTVIATASRPETQSWVRELGAHQVVDHSRPLAPQLEALGFPSVDIVAILAETARHADQVLDIVAPQGHVGMIETADALKAFDPQRLFSKSVALHPEFMFTRSMFATADMIEQHRLLTQVAELIDAGVLRTTLGEVLGPIDAAHLRQAHALIESGKARGKVVLAGWPS